MRQKLGNAIDGMAGNAAEDIFEPSEWINAARWQEAIKLQHGSRPTADIAAEKQPIAATYRNTADALFSSVIVCVLKRCMVLPGESPGRLTLVPAGST